MRSKWTLPIFAEDIWLFLPGWFCLPQPIWAPGIRLDQKERREFYSKDPPKSHPSFCQLCLATLIRPGKKEWHRALSQNWESTPTFLSPSSSWLPSLFSDYSLPLILQCCCSVAKLCPTLRPPGLQHASLSCPSLSPGVCSNSCPLIWWCHQTVSSSVAPFTTCPQSFLASGSFLLPLSEVKKKAAFLTEFCSMACPPAFAFMLF